MSVPSIAVIGAGTMGATIDEHVRPGHEAGAEAGHKDHDVGDALGVA